MPEPLDIIDPFDDAPLVPAYELFRRLGFEPRPPDSLDDFELTGRLWEFIYAMAGWRIFLYHTNHLNDRELYEWLYDEWFHREIADIPPESGWNCRVTPADDDSCSIAWLKYYALEEDRLQWSIDFPDEPLPPHVDPIYDRDQWLPEPANEAEEAEAELEFDEDDDESGDLLGLEAVDAEISASRSDESTPDLQPGINENWKRPIDQLKKSGVSLLPPDELTDATVTSKLWELLHSLACRGFYVLHTDHLSDREVYTQLWHHGLRTEALLPGKSKAGGWYHDFIGTGSEEHHQLWLRFYATEAQRAQYVEQHPHEILPAREKPPFQRDWRLPKGPF